MPPSEGGTCKALPRGGREKGRIQKPKEKTGTWTKLEVSDSRFSTRTQLGAKGPRVTGAKKGKTSKGVRKELSKSKG